MVLRIRLARFGKRHRPFYNIVLIHRRTARNSKPLEVLGTFDPLPQPPQLGQSRPWKDIKLDLSRTKYWLGVGAQPSEPAWRLLALAGLLEPRFTPSIDNNLAEKRALMAERAAVLARTLAAASAASTAGTVSTTGTASSLPQPVTLSTSAPSTPSSSST